MPRSAATRAATARVLCVVEEPKDAASIEKSALHKGRYHILGGAISPLDGVGPEDLRVQELLDRVERDHVTECILATNPNLEGNATAMYVAALLKPARRPRDAAGERPAGGRRPRVRGRGDAVAGPRGPEGDVTPSRSRAGTPTTWRTRGRSRGRRASRCGQSRARSRRARRRRASCSCARAPATTRCTSLWVLDVAERRRALRVRPARRRRRTSAALTPAERARRERMRERAKGVVAYACDDDLTRAVFVERGGCWSPSSSGRRIRELDGRRHARRPAALTRRLARGVRARRRALRAATSRAATRVLAADDDRTSRGGSRSSRPPRRWGGTAGYWWSPDGAADRRVAGWTSAPVAAWWIADPTDPAAEPYADRATRAPGPTNAVVTLHVVDVAAGSCDRGRVGRAERFEYLLRSLGRARRSRSR